VPIFKDMEKLCRILQAKRFRRGAIDFDFPESKVKLDVDGKVKEIVKVERSIADQIIEEFMICANETVAEHFFWLEAPFIYRVHEKPSTEKLLTLNEFLHLLGYHIKGNIDDIHPRAYQDVVEKVSGRPEEKVVSTVLLRSMKHARYDIAPLGHFGLSSAYYSHFTSPIRRYPDLAIHRVIKKYLNEGNPADRVRKKMLAKMEQYAVQSSDREKIAEEAERESVDLKKVEYMRRHLHEEFQGIISGVTQFGFFVELDNSCEGLVHVSTLTDDYYEFHDKQFMLLGKRTAKSYRIGDSVKIHVMRADIETRQIDFEVVHGDKEEHGSGNSLNKERHKKK
jgi:ribonuclease R